MQLAPLESRASTAPETTKPQFIGGAAGDSGGEAVCRLFSNEVALSEWSGYFFSAVRAHRLLGHSDAELRVRDALQAANVPSEGPEPRREATAEHAVDRVITAKTALGKKR